MADRKKRMSVDYRTEGATLTFYNEEDASEAGSVLRDVAGNSEITKRYGAYLMARGYADLLAQRVSKLYGAACLESESKLWGQLVRGEWSPDSIHQPKAVEPSDLALAIAEVQHLPVAHVMDVLENTLQTNEDGSPRLNGAGRKMRLFTDSYTHNTFLPSQPQVQAVMARLARERADRLTKEAKAAGKAVPEANGPSLGSLFGHGAIAAQ